MAISILLIEFGLVSAFHALSGSDISSTVAFFLIILVSMGLLYDFNHNKRLKDYKQSLTAGYLFRLFLLLFDLYGNRIYVLPNSGADSEMFYRNAVQFSRVGYCNRGLYPEMMGTIFRFIGTNRLYGQFLSMLASIAALTFLAYALNELEISEETKKKIHMIVCLLPNFAINTSIFIREGSISMCLAISFYEFTRWIKEKQNKYFIIAALMVFPAAGLHSGTIAVLVGYIVILFMYDNKGENIRIKAQNIILSVLLLVAAAFILSRYGDRFLSKFGNADSIEDIANTRARGGSTYAQYVGNSNNPLNMLIYTLPRIFYFLFSPLPWQWRGLSDLIAFFFSSVYYFTVIVSIFKYLRHGEKSNRATVIAMTIIAAGTIFVFAWGTSNTGTATRHRDKLMILSALIWALTSDPIRAEKNLKKRKNSRRRYRYGV